MGLRFNLIRSKDRYPIFPLGLLALLSKTCWIGSNSIVMQCTEYVYNT